jgi:predicted esterase
MNTLTFNALWDEAMQKFRDGEYAEVYDMLTREGERFPDERVNLIYLRACAAARQEDNGLALQLLEEARQESLWLSQWVMRESPSFQPLQGIPAFEEVREAFRVLEEAAQIGPVLLTAEPDGGCRAEQPCPVLVAMHGNGENGRTALEEWRSAVSEGWLLAVAQSSQVVAPNSYAWNDRERGLSELREHYASLREQQAIDAERVVVAGFSMGAETAIRAALEQTIPARGFIAIGPSGPTLAEAERWQPLIEAARGRGLRGYVLLGENDHSIPQEEIGALVEQLNAGGVPCELEVYPNLAHQFPPDFEAILARALTFVVDA